MKAYLQTKADGQWCAAVWQDERITQELAEKWAAAHAETLGLEPDALGWVLSPHDDQDLREGDLLAEPEQPQREEEAKPVALSPVEQLAARLDQIVSLNGLKEAKGGIA